MFNYVYVFFRGFRCKVSLLFFVCFLMRFCFTGKYLDSYDSIDFALGLRDYDLSLLQPHFPGYPVYIFTSWLFFKLFHNDTLALIIPSVLFGSLTVFPLYFLARRLFSERIAILTCIFYLINPLCWLQAERPMSDAMGLFFIMLSTYFLYDVCHAMCTSPLIVRFRSIPSHVLSSSKLSFHIKRPRESDMNLSRNFNRLFWGSLVLGFGLGIRLSYFPFVISWVGIVFFMAIQKIPLKLRGVTYGLLGFIIGICLWLLPQIGYVGWHHFWQNCFSFLCGHFIDWGGSIVTFGGFERVTYLMKSIWVHGLGGWWFDTSFYRIVPSFMILTALLYAFKWYHFLWHQWWFLGLQIIPYILWVSFGQNVANPRHMMPIIPPILMLISYGLYKIYEKRKITVFCARMFMFSFIAVLSLVSFLLVIQYHSTIPAPLLVMQFIKQQFDINSARIYCGGEKRFFDYYEPLWDVRSIRDITELNIDIQSSLWKPHDILVIHSLRDIRNFEIQHPPLMLFQENPYTNGGKEKLLLYKL
ncbi:MAG: glycosyltransferase family 39 protein [wastewater metagenome]|nr:glycosyltransferase family 39 protein [Candidatus Loosdrechtia aerotolerans]